MTNEINDNELEKASGGDGETWFEVFKEGTKFHRYMGNWEDTIEIKGNNGDYRAKDTLMYTVYEGAKPTFMSTYDYKWNEMSHAYIEGNFKPM